jgi:DNA-binding HxlR family transcriptional regulator
MMNDLTQQQIEQIRHALASSSLDFVLQKMGDHWSIAIIMHAFLGVKQFDVFQHTLAIPRQTLSVRLKQLQELGVFERRGGEYCLTAMGQALHPLTLICHGWETRFGPGSEVLAKTLPHGAHVLQAQLVCSHCRQAAGAHNVLPQYVADCQAPEWQIMRARRGVASGSDAGKKLYMIGIVGNRWSMLLLMAVFLGCHRYDELQAVLGVGSKVLADRLKSLCELGLLRKQADLHDARRFLYTINPSGRELFAFIVLISQWCENWLTGGRGSIRLLHLPCGQLLVPQVACGHCGEAV